MQAEIIAIGDEILVGQTIDTNSGYTASRLSEFGIEVYQKRVVADRQEAILEALSTVHPESKFIFMTGGLGPTKDDITKSTLLEFFGGQLVENKEVLENIKRLFASFNAIPREANLRQALVPNTCTVINNQLGTAPGMRFEKEGRFYFSTPGVPYETRHLVGEKIIPWIDENFGRGKIFHRSFLTQGVPESILAERLKEWEDQLPAEVHLAYLPSPGMVRLRLSGFGESGEESQNLVNREGVKLKEILGETIFGEGETPLAAVLGQELLKREATLATAESCTGGNLAHMITEIPGSSRYFEGGVVSYSNSLKQNLLGVKPETLQKHGAVSEATVREMAEGARRKLSTDYAISTSGVAGPDGGTEEKPVGLVWIAVAGPHETLARSFRFGRDRGRNIRRSSFMALDLCRRMLIKN